LISTETLNSEKDGENHYSIGVLVKMDKIDKNGKKFSKEEAYKLDPSKSLDEIVAEVMELLEGASFSFLFSHYYRTIVFRLDSIQVHNLLNSRKAEGTQEKSRALLLETQDSRKYITEELLVRNLRINKSKIYQKSNRIDKGSTLLLGTSPDRLVSHILKLIQKRESETCENADYWHQNLSYLLAYSEDIVFNRIFITKNGLKILLSIEKKIQEANLQKILTILMAFLEDNLIDFKDILSHHPEFTEMLINLLNERTSNGDVKLLQKTINLLERGLHEVPVVRAQIFKLLNDSPILHTRISDKEEKIQLASLMLVNSVLFTSRKGF
jgi:hypothetical protein